MQLFFRYFLRHFAVILFFILSIALLPRCVKAAELQNGSFEQGLTNWTTTVSTVQTSILTADVKDASRAAQITYASTTSNGIKQQISQIEGNKTYQLIGWLKVLQGAKKVFLRIAWYQSGSTSQIKTDDSVLAPDTGEWAKIELIATSPSSATSAEIRVLVSEGSGAADDLSWSAYTPPTATPSPTATPTPIATATPTPADIPQGAVHISELYAYPSSGGSEWIELLNTSDSLLDMRSWYLDDIENGGSAPKLFDLQVPAHGFATLLLSTSMFNNSGDTVRLVDTHSNMVDSFEYVDAQQGYSFSRQSQDDDLFCLTTPTESNQNASCIQFATPTPTPHISSTSASSINIVKGVSTKISSAQMQKDFEPTPAPYFPYALTVNIPNTSHPRRKRIAQSMKAPSARPKDLRIPAISYSLLSVLSLSWKMYLSARR